MLVIHSFSKEHNIDQNTLGCIDKSYQVEHSEIKLIYVATRVKKVSV